MRFDALRLKVDLLTKGVRGSLKPLREGGGGPVGGVSFKVMHGNFVVNAPFLQSFVEASPYKIDEVDGAKGLFKHGKAISRVYVPKEPEYYRLRMDGIEMRKIVALDGIDTLVTSVLRFCSHEMKCSFCSLEQGKYVKKKNPEQIAKVVRRAFEEGVGKHLVITTGTPPTPDKGASLISKVVEAVKDEVNIPIQVQIEPPKKPEFLDVLHKAGADAISLNVETFDTGIRNSVVPCKPSVEEYVKCWKHSLDLFDEVSSWIIVGLGESFESIANGCSTLCQIGVIPFVVPYRPPPNTNQKMCGSSYLLEIYTETSEIMKEFGIKPRGVAGCVKCQACSAVNEALKTKIDG